jgi:hypothetical protein
MVEKMLAIGNEVWRTFSFFSVLATEWKINHRSAASRGRRKTGPLSRKGAEHTHTAHITTESLCRQPQSPFNRKGTAHVPTQRQSQEELVRRFARGRRRGGGVPIGVWALSRRRGERVRAAGARGRRRSNTAVDRGNPTRAERARARRPASPLFLLRLLTSRVSSLQA